MAQKRTLHDYYQPDLKKQKLMDQNPLLVKMDSLIQLVDNAIDSPNCTQTTSTTSNSNAMTTSNKQNTTNSKANKANKVKKSKPTIWQCNKIWDYQQNGGIYSIHQLNEAYNFYNSNGFVVIRDVIDEKENISAKKLLLNDLKEINKYKNLNNINWNDINDLNKLTNRQLPGWASNGIRLQFGISHGRFANYSRLRPNIAKIYAYFHKCNVNELCCSFDSIAVTPYNGKHRNTLWLHADQSIYNHKHKKINGWNYNSIQGALYYTQSNKNTVSFVCSPKSHTKYWNKVAMNSTTKSKHWLLIDQICNDKLQNNNNNDKDGIDWIKMRKDIMNDAYRIHVPKNSFLLWNSKVFHQNGDSLNNNNNNNNNCMKRIASFISMSPNKLRDINAFKHSLIFAINGRTSTHWSQFMYPHIPKHPRFSKGNCYENMCDIKPILNNKITENQFKKMIPNDLIGKQIKIYNNDKTEPLSLSTVHHLGIKDLNKFKIKDLWNLIDPKLKTLQPWINNNNDNI